MDNELEYLHVPDTKLLLVKDSVERVARIDDQRRLILDVGTGNLQVHMGRVVKRGEKVDGERFPLGCYVHYDACAARQINLGRGIYFVLEAAAVQLVEDARNVRVVENKAEWEKERGRVLVSTNGPSGEMMQ